MSTSIEFTDYVLELLDPLGPVSISRMFGGVLLKVKDRQLGVIIQDRLYFKVTSPGMQETYKEKGSAQFSYTRRDKENPIIINNWWSVPSSSMDNSAELVNLAEEVLDQKVA